MKSLTESPALLTVHESAPGHYVLRVRDTSLRPLIVGVTKLLPDAESFVVVTPSDIKVFSANGDGPAAAAEPAATLDPEMQAAIAEAEGVDTSAPPQSEVVGDTPQGTKVVRRKKPSSVANKAEPCGRCTGTGVIQMILDGGGTGEAACPVCKGSGTMNRFGVSK